VSLAAAAQAAPAGRSVVLTGKAAEAPLIYPAPGTVTLILLDALIVRESVEVEGRARFSRVDPGVKDGPVTGALARAEGKAPVGTLLDGHLWTTTGDWIYGRYYRAHLPGGRTVPICVELQTGANLGHHKEEESKPGAPVGLKESSSVAVERWR
jgi:hypothetical protein